MMMKTLYYIHDPMCSWCWGFANTWNEVQAALKNHVEIHYVVGGLAPDSDTPMLMDMQLVLQNTWRKIESTIPGISFNYDFWSECQPRRSTYPACRAVLAAKKQNHEKFMVDAIQKAYYQEARNPSDLSTLIAIADQSSMNVERFKEDVLSNQIERELQENIILSRQLGAEGFPSLVLVSGSSQSLLRLDYNSVDATLKQILA